MTWISAQPLGRRGSVSVAWFIELLQLSFVLSVLLYFLLPGNLLVVLGWAYLGGGAEYQKIHIATYFLILVFGLQFSVDTRFRNTVVSLCFTDFGLLGFGVAVFGVASYAIIAKNMSVAPFVDTFVAALIVAIGCICLSDRHLRNFKYLLNSYFIISIAIMFFEYFTKFNIIYPEATLRYHDFYRSSALFEGPLSAASLLALYSIIMLVSTPISMSLNCAMRLLLAFASFAAILTTGGRTSLVVCVAIAIGYIGISFINQFRRGYFTKVGLIYFAIALPLTVIGLVVFLSLGLFDTIAARFQDDIGSAYSRQLALDLVFNMSIGDLWFGLSPGDVLNLVAVQQELGLIAIEISWVNFILVCGLIFTIPLFLTYLLFLFRFLPKYCGSYVIYASLFLLITTAASNGIWSKTTILSTSVGMFFSFMGRVDLGKRCIRS